MKAFKFSLQALLTMREQQEQIALQAYAKALQAQERAYSLLESTRQQLDEASCHFQIRLNEGCSASELAQLRAWCDSIQDHLKQCEHKAIMARNEAKRYFTKLLTARHATSVLLKLQENQLRHHRREQRQLEQKLQDDLAGRRSSLGLLLHPPQRSIWN